MFVDAERRKNTRRIGAYYEEQAAQYLQSKGYTIIKRNYKTPYGEIDLIAKKTGFTGVL